MITRDLLYFDVDETFIAECLPGGAFDLRPGVASQLWVLSKMFECYWLTHRSEQDLAGLWHGIFADSLMKRIKYADWRAYDRSNKAPYVLAHSHDFWWMEDPLSTGRLDALETNGLMNRFIAVQPKGMWGFTRACRVLFNRKGIKLSDVEKFGGKPSWFTEPLGDHFDWTYYE